MQRISYISRLLLVVVAVLGYQDATAQADASGSCCPPGYIAGELIVGFEPGTSRDRAEEIAVEFGFQVTRFVDFSFGPISVSCVPLGEEFAFITMLEPLPEVRYASLSGVFCGNPLFPCECCPCGFVCEIPGLPVLPPCPECELDADADRFADVCDTCTDTDDDGFGDPGFGYNVFGRLIRTCPIDNCPDAANPDQADLDGDGIGDACDRKLTICHRPPGKPAGAHTITIAVRAFPAHLGHGDVPGECLPSGPNVLALVPSASTYGVGESVVLQMYVSGATNVDAISFSLRHDPAVVQYVGAIEGTFMNSDGRQTTFLASPTVDDEIEMSLSRRGGGQGAAGTDLLVTVEFLAVGVGDAGFAFTDASVEDPKGRALPAAFNTALILVVP